MANIHLTPHFHFPVSLTSLLVPMEQNAFQILSSAMGIELNHMVKSYAMTDLTILHPNVTIALQHICSSVELMVWMSV